MLLVLYTVLGGPSTSLEDWIVLTLDSVKVRTIRTLSWSDRKRQD